MCVRRKPVVTRPKRTQSAITNRSRAHQKGDERSAGARRFRDLIAAYSAGLGELNEFDFALVRQAAALTLKSEQMQAALAAGADVDPDALIRLAGESRRSLAAVSAKAIDRKPASQTLQEYLAAKHAATLQSDDGDDEGE
jgi:hypothetical protein